MQLGAFCAALGTMTAGTLLLGDATPAPPSAKEERARYRERHRPYDGAPPLIPHRVDALGRRKCLGCHREGLRLDDGSLSPMTPHPERINCLQCHIEVMESIRLFSPSRFVGLRHPPRGTRMHAAAPPALPHPLHERERCLACHGERGGSPFASPHPERINCLQCHLVEVSGGSFFTRSETR